MADKTGPRMSRLRSAGMVCAEEEDPAVQSYFERVFMSKPVEEAAWDVSS